jgi:hypothetical protein
MKSRIPGLFLALAFLVALPATSADAAGGFDDDVFGRYVGFTGGSGNGSSFKLQFTQSLQLSYSYRVNGVSVREIYRALESGGFVGILRARGRLLGTVSGTWTGSARSIHANGKVRLANGRQARFSSRIRFGQGTVSVATRAAGNVVRSSGVKA